MKKFNFQLETVLNYRQQQEGMFKLQLAQARLELSRAQDKLEGLVINKKDLLLEMSNKESEGINIHQALMYRDYIEILKVKINKQKKVIINKQQKFKKCKEKLLAKTKECKILDKLKEKKFNQYQEEFLREEQKTIDEVASNLFNRQNSSEEVLI